MPSKVILKIETGPIAGKKFVFDSHDTLLFGRQRDCHARIPKDGLVSRHHFILEVSPPLARIRDLGSLNGTLINDTVCGGRKPDETPQQGAKRRHEHVDLNSGDQITVGSTRIRVYIENRARCKDCGCEIGATTNAPELTEAGELECDRCRQDRLKRQLADTIDETVRCVRCGAKYELRPTAVSGELSLCNDCRFAAELGGTTLIPPPSSLPDRITQSQLASHFDLPGYEIQKELGKGGMGIVYLARTRRTVPQEVAIKRMLAHVAVDEGTRKQFLREAEIHLGLVHRNIVHCFEQGAISRQFYFVMEYCNVGNLEEYAARAGGRLPLNQVAPLLLQCLDGLVFAHDNGFVHRDLKPQNLLLVGNDGNLELKISDFGLAKCFELAGLSGMTATGAVGGSWYFMPREQMTNFKYVQPASDVWSVAATFYRVLTGHHSRIFPADRDPIEVILNDGCTPIRRYAPTIPKRLASAIDKALDVDPARRFADARELRSAVAEVLT